MFDLEDCDDESFVPSILDKLRLEDMSVGEKVGAESGLWTVYLYRDGYSLVSNKIKSLLTFKTLQDLLNYLNK